MTNYMHARREIQRMQIERSIAALAGIASANRLGTEPAPGPSDHQGIAHHRHRYFEPYLPWSLRHTGLL